MKIRVNSTEKIVNWSLFHFLPNLTDISKLREELETLKNSGDVHTQNYLKNISAGSGYDDPVSSYVHKLMTLEHRISRLERYTRPIERLLSDLRKSTDIMSTYYLRILEDFYFEGRTVSELLELTHWNRTTFYSRRLSLLNLAAGYFLDEAES